MLGAIATQHLAKQRREFQESYLHFSFNDGRTQLSNTLYLPCWGEPGEPQCHPTSAVRPPPQLNVSARRVAAKDQLIGNYPAADDSVMQSAVAPAGNMLSSHASLHPHVLPQPPGDIRGSPKSRDDAAGGHKQHVGELHVASPATSSHFAKDSGLSPTDIYRHRVGRVSRRDRACRTKVRADSMASNCPSLAG